MHRIPMLGLMLALAVSCTTLDQSFRLGATAGSMAGSLATYAARATNGQTPDIKDVGLGASVGLGLGLISAYFIHQQVLEDRQEHARETEIYFGDLPPSPFIIPSNTNKKGAKE